MNKRWLTVVLVGMLLMWPHTSWAHEICFDKEQTPYCLTDPFSDYWEVNGGLPVFGYPIAERTAELNRDTGEIYPTQWLERNRFEYHEANKGTPYAVLLGLLGKERLAQVGRDWLGEGREAGPREGCIWFEETGHNVCNQAGDLGFKPYWETHGLAINGLDSYARSLQLFGLPLTESRMETNSSGDSVLTQWFERARFEWHPDNPDQFKVLLGLLGTEAYDQTAPAPEPHPTPLPNPIPIPEPQPTPASAESDFNDYQGAFWVDWR